MKCLPSRVYLCSWLWVPLVGSVLARPALAQDNDAPAAVTVPFPDRDCGFEVSNPESELDPPGEALPGTRSMLTGNSSCTPAQIAGQQVLLLGRVRLPDQVPLGAAAITLFFEHGEPRFQGWWLAPTGYAEPIGDALDPIDSDSSRPSSVPIAEYTSIRINGAQLLELCSPCMGESYHCDYRETCSCCETYGISGTTDALELTHMTGAERPSWRVTGDELTVRQLDASPEGEFVWLGNDMLYVSGPGSFSDWSIAPPEAQPRFLALNRLLSTPQERAPLFTVLDLLRSHREMATWYSDETARSLVVGQFEAGLTAVATLTALPDMPARELWQRCGRDYRGQDGHEADLFPACIQGIPRLAARPQEWPVEWCHDVAWLPDGRLVCVEQTDDGILAPLACTPTSCEPAPGATLEQRWDHPDDPLCAPFAAATTRGVTFQISWGEPGTRCGTAPKFDACTADFYAALDFGEAPPPAPSEEECAVEEPPYLCEVYSDLEFYHGVFVAGLPSDGPVWSSLSEPDGSAGHHPSFGYYSAVGPLAWRGSEDLVYTYGDRFYTIDLTNGWFEELEAETLSPELLSAAGYTADGRYRYFFTNSGGDWGDESAAAVWRLEVATGEEVLVDGAADGCDEAAEGPRDSDDERPNLMGASVIPSPDGRLIAVQCDGLRVFELPL